MRTRVQNQTLDECRASTSSPCPCALLGSVWDPFLNEVTMQGAMHVSIKIHHTYKGACIFLFNSVSNFVNLGKKMHYFLCSEFYMWYIKLDFFKMVYSLFVHLLPKVSHLLFAYAKASAIRYATLACYVARISKFIYNITKWSLFLAQTEVCFLQECEVSSYGLTHADSLPLNYHIFCLCWFLIISSLKKKKECLSQPDHST